MSSLLTATQKASIQAALANVHDTFARDIYVYVETKIATANTNTDYNPLYGYRKTSTQIQSQKIQLTKHTFQARILYNAPSLNASLDNGAAFGLSAANSKVRIKVKKDAYEKIKICSKIEIDGSIYVVDGGVSDIGPFDAQFYMIPLKIES